MYQVVKVLHSYWAYLVLLVLVLATVNAVVKTITKKEYTPQDFRISLFSLITAHIQLLLGIALWLSKDYFSAGVSVIMKTASLRKLAVEHPLMLIISVALITIGYSKHKKKLVSNAKLKTIAIFYSIALALVLSMIPWGQWL